MVTDAHLRCTPGPMLATCRHVPVNAQAEYVRAQIPRRAFGGPSLTYLVRVADMKMTNISLESGAEGMGAADGKTHMRTP